MLLIYLDACPSDARLFSEPPRAQTHPMPSGARGPATTRRSREDPGSSGGGRHCTGMCARELDSPAVDGESGALLVPGRPVAGPVSAQ